MKLIDANELITVLDEELQKDGSLPKALLVGFAKQILNDAPTVDAIPVVRCKDCKNYNAGFECLKEGYGIEYPQDWYCADGERRKG